MVSLLPVLRYLAISGDTYHGFAPMYVLKSASTTRPVLSSSKLLILISLCSTPRRCALSRVGAIAIKSSPFQVAEPFGHCIVRLATFGHSSAQRPCNQTPCADRAPQSRQVERLGGKFLRKYMPKKLNNSGFLLQVPRIGMLEGQFDGNLHRPGPASSSRLQNSAQPNLR